MDVCLLQTDRFWLEKWFRNFGFGSAMATSETNAFLKWREGRGRVPTERGALYQIMARTSRLHIGSISHYWSEENWRHLSDKTRVLLDKIVFDLGGAPPVHSGPSLRIRGIRRVALLAQLGGAPSPRFHLEVIRTVSESFEPARFSVSIHNTGTDAQLFDAVRRVVAYTRPHAIAMLRVTPDSDSLDFLFRRVVPVVIIHGALRVWRSPVIAHVIPNHSRLQSAVTRWARGISPSAASPERYAVVAAMPPETGGPESIRNVRVSLIVSGLGEAGLAVVRYNVEDYSAGNAFDLVNAHPNALAYVCLSDELAVATAQLLETRGVASARARILGFDASPVAKRHGIASFDQHLKGIGQAVAEAITAFFEGNLRKPWSWPSTVPQIATR